ncbi:hypothetical protein [Edaphocola aurantiacus]|nr:hypothetical protein [Edaphocola aurantiacus]
MIRITEWCIEAMGWASSKWKTGTINFLSGVKEAEQEDHKF